MSERPLVLGVDPGLHGALALYDFKEKRLAQVADMPIYQPKLGKPQLNVHSLATFLDGHAARIKIAVVEEVHAMPGQGVTSMFNFGKSYGSLIGVLATCMVPIHFIKPSVWKVLMGVTASKATSLEAARRLFPGHTATFSLKKHDGRAEAALLAKLGADRLV